MDIRNRRAIHHTARERLAAAPGDPRSIALWYTLICSAMALTATVLTGILTDRIADTGGLASMGLRSILSTGQTILPIVQAIITGCLTLGYHYAILCAVRGESSDARNLAFGFRHFGPMLRASLFQGLLYLSYGMISMYLASTIFMATPFAEPFYAVMDPLLESGTTLNPQMAVDESVILAASTTLKPLLWIWGGIFLLLFLPAYYSFRMTTFCIADNPRRGALASLHQSKLMLRRNRIALLKLDISLWWFYVLQFLISLVCYGDVLLPMVGVELPFNSTVSYYLFFVLSLVLQIVTYYFLMNRVYAAYAVVYEGLTMPGEPRQPQQPTPENLPFRTDY